MGVLETSLPALITGAVAIFTVVWQSRKTRRTNTDEHQTNAIHIRQAVESADRAAASSARAERAAARTEGRLSQYIEDHSKVHASIPRS